MATTPDTNGQPAPGKKRGANVVSIFLSLIAVASVVLTGEVKTPLEGTLLALAALALAAFLNRIILLWGGRIDVFLLLFLVAALVSSMIFVSVTFGRPRITFGPPRTDSLQNKDIILSVVPSQLRPTCTESEDDFFEETALSMKCSSGNSDVSEVHLGLYTEPETLYDAYRGSAEQAKVRMDSGHSNCTRNKAGEGPWYYENHSLPGGRIFCFLDGDKDAWIEWIYDERRVYAYANREGNSLSELYKWWEGF